TTSTREGIYIVFLFSSNYKSVYLTLNQGTTKPNQFGPRYGKKEIFQNTQEVRELLHEKNELLKQDNNADIADEKYKLGAIYYSLWDTTNEEKGTLLLKLYLDIYHKYKVLLKNTIKNNDKKNRTDFQYYHYIDIIM